MSGLERRLARVCPNSCVSIEGAFRMIFGYADDLKIIAKSSSDL